LEILLIYNILLFYHVTILFTLMQIVKVIRRQQSIVIAVFLVFCLSSCFIHSL